MLATVTTASRVRPRYLSVFQTARALTRDRPVRERAAWLFLGGVVDLLGVVMYRRRQRPES
jgi:hypothetical protein